MIYYAIRHKATNELMPLTRRNRGYTHWNPVSNIGIQKVALNVPRLFESGTKAYAAIIQWAATPNLVIRYNEELCDTYRNTTPDGRKRDDLEVIEVELVWSKKFDKPMMTK